MRPRCPKLGCPGPWWPHASTSAGLKCPGPQWICWSPVAPGVWSLVAPDVFLPRCLGLLNPKIWDPTGPECPCLGDQEFRSLVGPSPQGRNLSVLPENPSTPVWWPQVPRPWWPQVPWSGDPRHLGSVKPGTDGLHPCPQWTHTFLLIDTAGLQGYELFFKTRELKKKWLEQFEMAL